MGAGQRRAGYRAEREIVQLHLALGVHCERVPLSGGARYRGNGNDVDLYIDGKDAAPLVAEVKKRKDGAGFTTLERWLGTNDVLFLRRNRGDPIVVLPWATWTRLLARPAPPSPVAGGRG